jgi:hypothetical protein
VREAALRERQHTFLEGRRLCWLCLERETLLEEEGLDLRVAHLREGKRAWECPREGHGIENFHTLPAAGSEEVIVDAPSWLVSYNTRGFAGIVGNVFVSLRIWVRALGTIAFPSTSKLFLGKL